MGESQDAILIGILAGLEEQNLQIQAQLKTPNTSFSLDKRALAIAITHLENRPAVAG